MNAANAADKTIVFLIALLQMLLCTMLLFLEFGIAYGGGYRPLLTPFLFFGFLSGVLLFSQRLLPRIFVIAWQIIFAILVLQYQTNATQRLLIFVGLMAALYLYVTTRVQWGRKARMKR